MMKKAILTLSIITLSVITTVIAFPASVTADNCAENPNMQGCPCADMTKDGNDNPAKDTAICKDMRKTDPEKEVTDTFQNVINLMLFGIGIIAVVAIIISGMRFVAAHGDSNAVSKARTSLIYSVVGLAVATLAFAIVNFVIFRLSDSGSGGGGGGGTPATCPVVIVNQNPYPDCNCPPGTTASGNPLTCR